MPTHLRSNHVFINCPFDAGYRPIFNAIVFTVYDVGLVARCALEDDDAADFRLSKIERIIEECKFGISDLSAVALDAGTGLPRFNAFAGISGQDIQTHAGDSERAIREVRNWLQGTTKRRACPAAVRSSNTTGGSRTIFRTSARRSPWNPTSSPFWTSPKPSPIGSERAGSACCRACLYSALIRQADDRPFSVSVPHHSGHVQPPARVQK